MLKLSPSSLGTYWRCPELFRKKYIDKEIERTPGNWKMVAGSAAHAGLEFGAKEKMDGREPDCTAMMLKGQAELEKEWAKGVDLPLESSITGGNVYKLMATKKMERCVQVVHKKYLPSLNVEGAEVWLEKLWRPDVKLRGKVDIFDRKKGKLLIRDLKVGGGRTPDKHSALKSHQLVIYAILVEMITGEKPVEGWLDHFVDSKRPHFTPRHIKFTDRMLDAMRMKIDRTVDAILAGNFPPGDPYWVCNAERCTYHPECPMGAGAANG